MQLIGARRYGEALNSLNECLRLEPALTVGYVARGSTLIGLRRFAEAAVDYQYALRARPLAVLAALRPGRGATGA